MASSTSAGRSKGRLSNCRLSAVPSLAAPALPTRALSSGVTMTVGTPSPPGKPAASRLSGTAAATSRRIAPFFLVLDRTGGTYQTGDPNHQPLLGQSEIVVFAKQSLQPRLPRRNHRRLADADA